VNQPLSGLRIGLLTASASRLGGGVFEALVQQAALIRLLGGEAQIFALRDAFSAADAGRLDPAPVNYLASLGPAQFGFAPGLGKALLEADLDVLHLHGIWMYPSWAGFRWARQTGRRYLVSPHGMLARPVLARNSWKKHIARIGYEWRSWKVAADFHALTAAEAADIARETGRTNCQTIPNAAPPVMQHEPAGRDPVFVYLGRFHAIKNLSRLIEGWKCASRPPQAKLVIAGWGVPDEIAAVEHAVALAGTSVEFVGPVFGEEKKTLLRRARFMVLPSLGEGLPMAILDGWAAGAPALLSRQCNLPEGFAAKAALDCGTTAESIAAALEQSLAMKQDDWSSMSKAALGLAGGQFSLDAVARQWAAAYRPGIASSVI
jgi:glycosyltransferase involved in cell wall biosynthesis